MIRCIQYSMAAWYNLDATFRTSQGGAGDCATELCTPDSRLVRVRAGCYWCCLGCFGERGVVLTGLAPYWHPKRRRRDGHEGSLVTPRLALLVAFARADPPLADHGSSSCSLISTRRRRVTPRRAITVSYNHARLQVYRNFGGIGNRARVPGNLPVPTYRCTRTARVRRRAAARTG